MVDAYLDQIESDQQSYEIHWVEENPIEHRLNCWFAWADSFNPIPDLQCDIDYDDTDYECPDCGYDTRYGQHQRIRGHSWSYPEYYCDGDMVSVE